MNEKAKFIEITEEQKEKINKIRLSFSDIYNCIEKLCENSREKSLAITKLEETQFWAIKGISREEKNMKNNDFENLCIKLVKDYANEHLDKSDNVVVEEKNVFVVWICKTLQNNKALLSTTLLDGMYYEITYNGDKKEIYLDAYKKFENRAIKVEE